MREQAGVIQVEVQKLLDDVGRLDKRADSLQKHFDQIVGDVRDVRISTDKVIRRAERIDEIQLGDETPAGDLPPPAPLLAGNGRGEP